ncbi:MAG: TIGR03663 family protein [bacterium]|nr:TIGR03663 family protein [bacterium]
MGDRTSTGASPEREYITIRLDWYRIAVVAILLFAAVTRLWGLAEKPFHHDESLYATYSWYIHEGRGYRYDPMLHGPFMFYLDALLFMLLGVSDFTARLSAAIFGIGLVVAALLFRRRLGRAGAVIAAALFAVSPVFMYFSRFFREDIFVAFWAVMTVALFANWIDTGRRRYLYGTAAALAFTFCVKENSYMFLAIFASFLVGAPLFERLFGTLPAAAPPERRSAPPFGILDAVVFLAVFFGIFTLFFTSFFGHPPGFLDGLYRKSLGYWIHQNRIQRIRGPFTYFCPLAAVYELPLVAVVAAGLAARLRRRAVPRAILFAASAAALPLLLLWHRPLPVDPWDTVFHMTSTMHVVFALYVLVLGLTATVAYLREGRRFPAFLSYWTWTSILLYSYAGEKVPWLLMHILTPMLLWAALLLGEFLRSERFRRAPRAFCTLFAAGLLLTLQASLRLCFVNEANPVETMVYTQTSWDIKHSLDEIARLAERTGKGFALPIGVQGESTWPYTWYLRDYKEWFHPGAFTSPRKAVVAVDWNKRGDSGAVLEPHYRERRLKLREWWVPSPVAGLRNPVRAWLAYYFRREVWSTLGSQDIAFYVRKDLLGEAAEAAGAAPEELAGPPTPVVPETYANVGVVPPLRVLGERGSAAGRLNEPRGIWIGADGSVFVADTKNHRWQKFDRTGAPLLSVGAEGAGEGQFREPMGIAVDDDGNVYVADTWNHRIQKFDEAGRFLAQWGGGAGGFWAPKGMAFDSAGDLHVVDTGRHRVQKFGRDGTFILTWGDRGEEPGRFSEPVGIAIERNAVIAAEDKAAGTKEARGDIVHVADTANRRVQRFDASGRHLGQFGVLGWHEYYTEPFAALDGAGRLWLTDAHNNRIQVFDREGELLALWSAKGFQPGAFNMPKGIAIRDGVVAVADTHNHRIQVFRTDAVYGR